MYTYIFQFLGALLAVSSISYSMDAYHNALKDINNMVRLNLQGIPSNCDEHVYQQISINITLTDEATIMKMHNNAKQTNILHTLIFSLSQLSINATSPAVDRKILNTYAEIIKAIKTCVSANNWKVLRDQKNQSGESVPEIIDRYQKNQRTTPAPYLLKLSNHFNLKED